MDSELIGYARCSTDEQDLTAQKNALAALGVTPERIYIDPGLTGTSRERPGLTNALAAVRKGDTLVVTKLDRLGRSVHDLADILSTLSTQGVRFQIGGAVHDWADPMSKMFLQILAVVAEFEADLIRMRTREGMAIAKAKGHLRGKQPKLSAAKRAHLLELADAGGHNVTELAELFSVSRPTVYRELAKAGR